jgi:Helix-turn-helix domain
VIDCERWQWRELFASEHGPTDTSTRLVLFVLSLHMNKQGQNAFPAQKLIAARSGLSERSVRTHLAHAQRAGWLRVYQKPRKGKAWFVHEYVACIPDALAEFCTSKPWEEDPNWQRAENSAGRNAESADKSPANGQHPANGAERPAILAQRAAIVSVTPGKICRDARQGLPTNSSSNSSKNPPSNSSVEGAALLRITDLKTFSKKALKSEEPEKRKAVFEEKSKKPEEPKEIRLAKAATLLKATPDVPIENIARMFNVTQEEALKVRQA